MHCFAKKPNTLPRKSAFAPLTTTMRTKAAKTMLPKLKAMIHQLETGVDLEKENFERLIEGTAVPMDELLEKALYNWYVSAEEAAERKLVAGIV